MRVLRWATLVIVAAALGLPLSVVDIQAEPTGACSVIKRIDEAYHGTNNMFHIGDDINYEIIVGNPEDFPLHVLEAWDVFSDDVRVDPPSPTLPYILNTGEEQIYYHVRTVTPGAVFFDVVTSQDVVQDTFFISGFTRYPDFDDPAYCLGVRTSVILMPDFTITKTADPLVTKPGHDVTYTICVENTGNCDLNLISVIDPLLGDLTASFSGVLAQGATECHDFTYTVQEADPDPLPNTVTAQYWDDLALAQSDATWILERSDDAEVDLLHPSIELTAECMTPEVEPGGNADIQFTFDNTGDVELFFDVVDNTYIPDFTLGAGGTRTETVTLPDPGGVDEICYMVEVVASLPQYEHLDNEYVAMAEGCCPITPTGENGCTPGYWKNHPECWCEDYIPADELGDVFTIPAELAYHNDHTMMDALNYTGGRLKGDRRADVSDLEAAAGRLLFHAVAAVLNGCHPDVPYPMSSAGVIAAVNAALATLDIGEFSILHDTLEEYNELGCSIDAHCIPIEPEEPMPDGPDAMDSSMSAPTQFVLGRSVPNPFKHTVKLSYGIPTAGRVKVEIFDVAGRRVVSLLDKQESPGFHSVVWDGKDSQGRKVSPGVYFTRVTYNGEYGVKKMILMQ